VTTLGDFGRLQSGAVHLLGGLNICEDRKKPPGITVGERRTPKGREPGSEFQNTKKRGQPFLSENKKRAGGLLGP